MPNNSVYQGRHTHSQGITLIELLIGLLLALIISGSLLALWLKLQAATLQSLQQSRLHQDLRAINHVMARDIRRAGYWGWTPDSNITLTQNPFMSAANDIIIDRADNHEPEASCLTYSYDANRDGLLGAGNTEQFGFRLHEQAIEMRTGGSAFNCHTGLWQDITQTGTIITDLRFTLQGRAVVPAAGCSPEQTCLIQRLLHIRLSGHLQDRPEQAVTLEEQINIRNDYLG